MTAVGNAAAGRRERHRSSRSRWGRAAFAVLALLAGKAIWDVATLPDPAPLASGPPPVTALMLQREAEAAAAGRKARRKQRVVALHQIAPTAVSSVVISEDASFFVHGGIDTQEIEAAIGRALETGRLRGASTITQQLAKNLWLSTERSLTRKLKELWLTRRLEKTLTKKRILWLYLNVVEWGDGVYGIDAAAREHFRTDAAHLTVAQGAMLASMLPAPRTWLPARRPAALYRRAAVNVGNLEAVGKISAAQARAARAELDAFFGGRTPPPKAPPGDDEPPPEDEPEAVNAEALAPSPEPEVPPELERGPEPALEPEAPSREAGAAGP